MKRVKSILLMIMLVLCSLPQADAQDYQEQMKLIRPRPENVLIFGIISLPDNSVVAGATVNLIDPFSFQIVETIPSDQKGWYLFSVRKDRTHGLLIELPGMFPYYYEFKIPGDYEEPQLEQPITLPESLTRIFTLVFKPDVVELEPKSLELLHELGQLLLLEPDLKIRVIPEKNTSDPRKVGHITEQLVSMGVAFTRFISSPTTQTPETTIEIRISSNPDDLTDVSPLSDREPANNSWTIQISASRSKIPMGRFKDLDPIFEFKGKDGYYRYTYGNFTSEDAAKKKLQGVKRMGYQQAFIKTVGEIKKL
ncbi:MAG: SPOR domain-containing protein [Bacteroidales bacterium]|nr:SPOR domain-containing protein [Bacteroidales bacterium]